MIATLKRLAVLVLLFGVVWSPLAFSPHGPYATFQTAANGYQVGGVDIGGPMNLGEEYRWNVKTIYYAYDGSFMQFFGVEGTNAVEKAIAIMNAVPNTSLMSSNLDEYPLNTTRINYQAASLGLLDLKSTTLGVLMEQIGLTSPERYTWCLRAVTPVLNPPPPVTNYTVIKRNFDPVTLNPSSYVNGTLYTYYIAIDPYAANTADAIEIQVDPLQDGFTAVASAWDDTQSGLLLGGYYTGLTRDDIGGIRHLYGNSHPLEHWHVETLLPSVTGTSSSSPWNPAGGTNAVNPIVGQAIRPGVEHLQFQQVYFDSLLGAMQPITSQWTDTYISNSVSYNQVVQRAVTAPDILFAVADIGLDNQGFPLGFTRTTTAGWINNDAINGNTTLSGPGVIPGPIVVTFNMVGPTIINQNPDFLDEYTPYSQSYSWGSFDGTANDPIIFPSGSSILDFKAQLINGGSPWTIPNSTTTNSAAAGGVAGAGN